jgi:uncharacterized protein with WD repeat
LAGFVTAFLLTGTILACGGSNGSDDPPPAGPPATIPAVVFIADKDNDEVFELYVSLNDGETILKLSGTMVLNGDVIDFKISPEGTRVAYLADQDTDGVIELYVNDINGGTPVKVSGVLVFGGNVELQELPPPNPPFTFDVFNWSPNSNWIAYIADQESDAVYELFVSTPDGTSNFKVSGSLVGNGDLIDFEWAPDSSRIAYRADGDANGVHELYTTTPSIPPTPNKVSNIAPGNGNVIVPKPFPDDNDPVFGTLHLDAFEWAPDSTMIAYVADGIINETHELFTVPPDGSASPTEVSAISGSPFDVMEFKWAPDSSRIAYRADQNADKIFELFTGTPDGSDNDQVSGALVANGDVLEFAWAPNSSLIAYTADQDTNDAFELYTSPPDSNIGNVKASFAPLVAGGNVQQFEWAPNSSLITYLADQDTDNVDELYTAPPDGSDNDEVSALDPMAIPGSDVFSFGWAPDSSRVAYIADQDSDNLRELYSALPDGSVNDKVSGPLQLSGRVFEFAWTPNSSRIAYRADQDLDFVDEIYSSQPDGSGNGKISGTITPLNGSVLSFEYEP